MALAQQAGTAAGALCSIMMVSKVLGLPFTDIAFVCAVCVFACSGARGKGGDEKAESLLPGMLRSAGS